MVPFDVNMGGKRVGISLESLFWFFVVTAAATVVGELVYQKWVQPYLANLPSLPPPDDSGQQSSGGNIIPFPQSGMMNQGNNPNLPQ